MKSLIVLAGLVALSTASAGTISCTPSNSYAVFGGAFTTLPLAFDCPPNSATGSDTIIAAAIEVFISFQDAVAGGDHQLMATATETSSEIEGTIFSTVFTPVAEFVGFEGTFGLGGSQAPSLGFVGLSTLGSFVVSVDIASFGSSLPNSASVTVAYTTYEGPIGPEPPGPISDVLESSSMLLSGVGILVIGVAFRRGYGWAR